MAICNANAGATTNCYFWYSPNYTTNLTYVCTNANTITNNYINSIHCNIYGHFNTTVDRYKPMNIYHYGLKDNLITYNTGLSGTITFTYPGFYQIGAKCNYSTAGKAFRIYQGASSNYLFSDLSTVNTFCYANFAVYIKPEDIGTTNARVGWVYTSGNSSTCNFSVWGDHYSPETWNILPIG